MRGPAWNGARIEAEVRRKLNDVGINLSPDLEELLSRAALGCRDLPAGLGDGPAYLIVQWGGGVVTGCRVAGPQDALDATYVLGMQYADWVALHGGYDAQRTVMYRKILLERGDLLEFFKTIYFFVECLAVVGSVPADYPAAVPR